MIEEYLNLRTADGKMDTYVFRPDEGGPFPAVLFYMDAPAMREELRDMARRLATAGHYVALPNLFYRAGTEGNYPFNQETIRSDQAEFQKMHETMDDLTNAKVVRDTRALLDHVRGAADAGDGPVGALGYCMSGQYVVSVLAEYPDNFSCGASFYGVRILTGADDSPHLKADRIRGELYLAFAETDRWVPPETLRQIEGVFSSTKVRHRVEHYPGTEHGFAFPDRYCYVKLAGERHWSRIFRLFRRRLPTPAGWRGES